MIERIFCGAVTRGSAQKEGRMSYTEFVWFLLSEEVGYKMARLTPFLALAFCLRNKLETSQSSQHIGTPANRT